MTKINKAITAVFVLLLCSLVSAVDLNTMSTSDVQAYIQALEAQKNLQQQPQIITVQMDAKMQTTIDKLEASMQSMERSNEQLNSRFAELATKQTSGMETLEGNIKKFVELEMDSQLAFYMEETKEYFRVMTNPIRMTLPQVAMFAILSAIFLLWTGKYYNKGGS